MASGIGQEERYFRACDDEIHEAVLKSQGVSEADFGASGRAVAAAAGMKSRSLRRKGGRQSAAERAATQQHEIDNRLIARHDHHWGILELAKVDGTAAGGNNNPSAAAVAPPKVPGQLPTVRDACAGTMLGGTLYIFGGIGPGRSGSLWRLALGELVWQQCRSSSSSGGGGGGAEAAGSGIGAPPSRSSSALTAVASAETGGAATAGGGGSGGAGRGKQQQQQQQQRRRKGTLAADTGSGGGTHSGGGLLGYLYLFGG
jgi:hypothetical protein